MSEAGEGEIIQPSTYMFEGEKPDFPLIPEQEVTNLQQVTEFISLQLQHSSKFTQEALAERQTDLQSRPHLGSHTLRHALLNPDQNSARFSWIEVDKIIGRQSPLGGDWSTEAKSRKGKIIMIADILSRPTDDNIEQIFSVNQKDEPIIAIAINGPSGPIYYIEDGTHRTAAAMVLGIKSIPVNLWRIKYPLTDSTYNKDLTEQWRTKLRQGYIDGSLDIVQEASEKCPRYRTNLAVNGEILPWTRCPNGRGQEISRAYAQVYPHSLNKEQYPIEQIFPSSSSKVGKLKSKIAGIFTK